MQQPQNLQQQTVPRQHPYRGSILKLWQQPASLLGQNFHFFSKLKPKNPTWHQWLNFSACLKLFGNIDNPENSLPFVKKI